MLTVFLTKSRVSFLKIKLDSAIVGIANEEYGAHDSANALVLPSKKRDSRVKKDPEATHVTRILSKKKRKQLEKIVDRKQKKEGVSNHLDHFRTAFCYNEQNVLSDSVRDCWRNWPPFK